MHGSRKSDQILNVRKRYCHIGKNTEGVGQGEAEVIERVLELLNGEGCDFVAVMVDIKLLDKILNETVLAIEQSKGRIFDIADTARNEYTRLEQQLLQVKAQVTRVIEQVDDKEKEFMRARVHLMDVSRYFNRYTEDDIKKAYESAQNAQVELVVLREREQNLRTQRDTLEISLRNPQAKILALLHAVHLPTEISQIGFKNIHGHTHL